MNTPTTPAAQAAHTPWTPEPWRYTPPPIGPSQPTVMSTGNPAPICAVSGCHSVAEERANAARIVACVNAMAGVPDPEAEIARLRRCEAALRPFANGNIDVSETAVILRSVDVRQALNEARAALEGGK